MVRTDRGTEYAGRFAGYCKSEGIVQRLISTMNPRANGQVERMVRVVKEGIRRMTAFSPDMRWWEVLPDIARGMRVLPNRATGYAPFTLVFKQAHCMKLPLMIEADSVEQFIAGTPEYLDHLVHYWDTVYRDVQSRQQDYDKVMIKRYMKSKKLAEHDVRYIFKPGDYVLLKQRQPGKMKVKAVGPYLFIKYNGKQGVTAVVETDKGRLQVSAANLLPVQTKGWERLTRYGPFGPIWAPDLEHNTGNNGGNVGTG